MPQRCLHPAGSSMAMPRAHPWDSLGMEGTECAHHPFLAPRAIPTHPQKL